MNHQTSIVPQVIPQVAYQSPQALTQLITESPFGDSGFAVPVFSPGDDPIACLNKAMAFLTAVASSRFTSINNQLRTSSNPRNQATIQDGRVTVQQVQGRQGQNYSGTTYKGNATSSRGNITSGQARVVKCYNCQGEGLMARKCTQPKRPRNAAWYKEKAMLAEVQEARKILYEEQLAFLADPRIPADQAQTNIPHNAAFQTEDLDMYDSDCDDLSTAQAVLMANISNYGSDIISEVPNYETYLNDMDNQSVYALQDFEQTPVMDFTDNEISSDSNIIPFHRLKKHKGICTREKMIDSQMDDMIREKLALKEQIDSLEQNLSKQIKEKESLFKTFSVFKNESKEKENKYMENEIDLEKKIKELDNIICKVGQSAQTVHMLTKPQAFYDNTHKQALGYQNPFYLKKAQRLKPTLYDGVVLSNTHVAMPVIDDEETLILEEESRSKMSEKAKDPEVIAKKISHKPIDYEKLNSLTDDFEKRFSPQQELSAEQAFWFHILNPSIESSYTPPVIVEVPSELPKVSLVNASLKKLKFHLTQFDSVVKKRTTPNALEEGEWGFEHTKTVFNNEIIPFLKSLKDIFNVFDKDLLNEITEVQTVFDQMEASVQQFLVDKKCLEIAKKEILLENDRLLQKIMSQDVLLTVINSMSWNNDSVNMEMQTCDSCEKCLNLDAELSKSKQAYNDLLKNYSQLEKHCISLEVSMQLKQEVFQNDESCDNHNCVEIQEYFEINDLKARLQDKDTTICKLKDIIISLSKNTKEENVNHDKCELEHINEELENSVDNLLSENERLCNEISHVKQDLKAQIQDKVFVITSLKNDLRKLKGKEIVENASQIPSAITIAPSMFKLDLVPLPPRLLENREAHIDYIKHTQENANILWKIVKLAKAKQPLDRVKCSTSNCGSKPPRNKKNDRISQKLSRNKKNYVEAQPRKVNKLNRVVKPVCDVDVKHSSLNANSDIICATCNKSMFDGVHDICLLDLVQNGNKRSKSAKKHKKQNIWKPTGHVFTEVGFKWKPTGKIFTIVVQIVLWYLDFRCSKHMTGNRSQLMNFISKFLGTVRFGNDQIARIMGYGDFQLGNVVISRVYYVEGLGHNLFSVGQFCDSDLEVAFQKNTCFIWNLEGVDLLSGSRDINLYTISLDDMLKSSPICLLFKASKTKSWLWHRRLSHLNFGTLNKLAKDGLARGIPRQKFQKDHLCSACALGKSKKTSHQPKAEDTNQEKLYLLHMDLCGLMRVASINGK
ncbi:retrovirus-related pol polyprotein from transposon TNT 1-94, partial [Tanacetum coccineum]